MKTIFFSLLVIISMQVIAQAKSLHYQSSIAGGVDVGSMGNATQLQTVQGIGYKTWSAGIGAGLDYYHTRSIPLFLDVRKNLLKNSKSAFVYADGGYHFPWLTDVNKESGINAASHGFYYDAGVGYELPAMKTTKLFFSLGISGKEFKTTETEWIYFNYIWQGQAGASNYFYRNHYRLQRVSIKMGLRF